MNFKKLWKSVYSSYIKIQYCIKELRFLKILNSPFVKLKLKWYFGEIKYGTPYFLPRKWVKVNKEDCERFLEEDKKRCLSKYIENRTWEYYQNHQKSVDIKYFHWKFTTLGWKTKYKDFRYEWSPHLSIVIFGKQLFIQILPNVEIKEFSNVIDCYWESWLHWEYDTDKNLSKENRFKELLSKHSNTWKSSTETTDYYYQILNKKYLKLYEEIMENK